MTLPLSAQTWGKEEVEIAKAVIDSGVTTMGNNVREFEDEFAAYFNSKHAVMSNSGSSANLLALAAISYSRFGGDPRGKEVIVPAVSWSTTYYPIHQLGFRIRIVDIDLQSLNLDVRKVESAITEHTAGIFAVNLLGQPADLIRLREIARENDIFLLEDNCESMGAELDGKAAGTYGDIGTFSFFFSHHINTMEGGMCLTDDLKLAQFVKSLRAHGWTRDLPDENHVHRKTGNYWDDHFRFVLPGYNFRPLEISGAIGKVQLGKFDGFLKTRIDNHHAFQSIFSEETDLIIQQGVGKSSAFAFSFVLTGDLEGKREYVVSQLARYGIESRPIVTGNFSRQPVMRYLNATCDLLTNAEYVDVNGFYVGNHHFRIDGELQVIREVLEQCRKIQRKL